MQTLINEVRRLGNGTEQQFAGSSEAEGRAGNVHTTSKPESSTSGLRQDAGSSTRELENRLCSQATRTRGVDWSFKLRFHVSVVDLQLGRMMEEAEFANAWLPMIPMNQDIGAQLRYLLVMLTSGAALQIIRQKRGGIQAFRDFARRYSPCSQVRSLAQLQELMHFDSGQELVGVTGRLIVFDRLVGV